MNNQGEKPDSLRVRIIGIAVLVIGLAAVGIPVANAAHNAQVEANAHAAMTAAAPAYQGAIEHGGTLDALNTKAVQAKAAYDAEQARLAAEKAAQEAAAAQAAAQAAAEAAAQQQASQQRSAASDDSGPVRCPAGTHAMAVDANGNESNCDPLNSQGQQCVAYDGNNQCTAWLQE